MDQSIAPLHTAPNHPLPALSGYQPAPMEERDSGWLFSFVDILMLLLTLFVVLLAISHSPKPKPVPAKARVAMQPPIATEQRKNAVIKPILPERAPAMTAKPAPPTPKTMAARAAPTRPILTLPEDLKHQVQITRSATALNLEIKDDVLFDTGHAEFKPTGLTLLARLAQLFTDNRYPISVEGHTDNHPIHTTRFPSNWELSTARATNVTRFLISQGVAADRLSAVGYADTRPRADNATAEGRAANRRVSLVVHVNN